MPQPVLLYMQYSFANYVSLLVSLGFVWTHASPQLHPARLPPRLMSAGVLGPIALFMGFFALEQGIAVVMLHRQPWYHPQESKVQAINSACALIQLGGLRPSLCHPTLCQQWEYHQLHCWHAKLWCVNVCQTAPMSGSTSHTVDC